MLYTPKEVKDNVNVTPRLSFIHYLKIFAVTIGGLAAFYFASGLVMQWIAPMIPPSVEGAMGRILNSRYLQKELPEKSLKVKNVLDRFIPHLSGDDFRLRYQIYVSENPVSNAYALPGGMIVINSELLKSLDDPQELAFIVAHELGHFHYRHHLRQAGRGMAAMLLTLLLTGENSGVSYYIVNTFFPMEMKFSRRQEYDADLFAIDLIRKAYGDVSADFPFMRKLTQFESSVRLKYYFASHPPPSERLQYMRLAIDKYNRKKSNKSPSSKP